jgi:hypothetical protein
VLLILLLLLISTVTQGLVVAQGLRIEAITCVSHAGNLARAFVITVFYNPGDGSSKAQ